MTDLETQVEALMQTFHTSPVSWEGSEAGPNITVVLSSDVSALLISLVQEKADLKAELDKLVNMPRAILNGLVGDDPEKQRLLAAWDAENELRMAAEASLATAEQDRDSLIAVVTPFVDLCDNCGGKGQIGLGLACDWCSSVRQVLAALTPSRSDV